MNPIDRLIEYIAPNAAIKRKFARSMLSGGGYDGGSSSSDVFRNFQTLITDADSSTRYDLDKLVARSRYNIRNVPVAKSVIDRTCDHAIGNKGLSLHPTVDRDVLGMSEEDANTWQKNTLNEWKRFSESKDTDYTREQNFNELTYLTLQSELEGGDCFSVLTRRENSNGYGLTIQTLEGEYCNTPTGNISNKDIIHGVEKDTNGVPTKYWFSKYHPGDRTKAAGNKWNGVKIFGSDGRRYVLHNMNKIRPGQSRGVPVLGPVTGKLLQLSRYSNAELMAAVINSYFVIVAQGAKNETKPTRTAPTDPNASSRTDEDPIDLGSGTIVRGADGVEYKSFDPSRPNLSFEPFYKAIVSEIGAAVGVPRSLILMSFDKSYSASRGEVLLAWAYFLKKRTHMAVNFCQPIYESFLDDAILRGYIKAPGYFNDSRIRKAYQGSAYNQWTGPTRPAIDEVNEATAHQTYINMGVKSRQDVTSEATGKEYQLVFEQIAREHKQRIDAGLEQ